jgi:hypothetical protein
VGPRSTIEIAFSVEIPDAGTRSERIRVAHSGSSDPLILNIEIVGHSALPVVRRIRNASPAFHALASASAESYVVVETRESLESTPWLKGLVCDLEEVLIKSIEPEETTRTEDYVDRIYSYQLSWNRLPSSPVFAGDLWLIRPAKDGDRLNIGRLTGSLDTAAPISPTVLHLDTRKESKDVVLFGPGTGRWDLAPGAVLPPFLEASWVASGDDRVLVIVAHRDAGAARQSGPAIIPLVSDLGGKAALKVIVRN